MLGLPRLSLFKRMRKSRWSIFQSGIRRKSLIPTKALYIDWSNGNQEYTCRDKYSVVFVGFKVVQTNIRGSKHLILSYWSVLKSFVFHWEIKFLHQSFRKILSVVCAITELGCRIRNYKYFFYEIELKGKKQAEKYF